LAQDVTPKLPSKLELIVYACECVRLAKLTDDEELRRHLLELARQWLAMREREYTDARQSEAA